MNHNGLNACLIIMLIIIIFELYLLHAGFIFCFFCYFFIKISSSNLKQNIKKPLNKFVKWSTHQLFEWHHHTNADLLDHHTNADSLYHQMIMNFKSIWECVVIVYGTIAIRKSTIHSVSHVTDHQLGYKWLVTYRKFIYQWFKIKNKKKTKFN